jgi:hypothetical protein
MIPILRRRSSDVRLDIYNLDWIGFVLYYFFAISIKKRTNSSKQEARSPPAAVFDAAGSLRASCLGAHA